MADPNAYAVLVRPLSEDDGGGFFATVPDLPGCQGDGDTPEAALADARAAIVEWIDSVIEDGGRVPQPSHGEHVAGVCRWQVRVPRSLHSMLVHRAKAEGVSLNSLVTSYLAGAVGFGGPGAEPRPERRRPAPSGARLRPPS